MLKVLSFLKGVPVEVYPLGVAIVGVLSFAGYRMYSLSRKPDVIFRKTRNTIPDIGEIDENKG